MNALEFLRARAQSLPLLAKFAIGMGVKGAQAPALDALLAPAPFQRVKARAILDLWLQLGVREW